MKAVHSEIEYVNSEGESIHSDTCPPDCNLEKLDPEYRELLHVALDEWLDNSNGTGIFYISEEDYLEKD